MDDDRGLSYFFLGLGVGAALGILFAPKSGEETRQQLFDRAQEGSDYLKRRGEESKDYLKRRGEEIRDQAADYVDRGRGAVSRQRDQLKTALDAGREAYRESVKSQTSSSTEGA